MADILRYITLDVGGRPVSQLDLNDMVSLANVRDSFTITGGTKQPVQSASSRRYGGSRQVGETTDNGQVSFSTLVMGSTADDCLQTVEDLLAQLEESPAGLLLEWRPDGASQSSLYEVRGTGQWTPKYQWVQFAGCQSMVFDVVIPTAPLALGLPLDILDTFSVDTRSDYVYDNGSSADERVTEGVLKGNANLGVEKRAIHTARGYKYTDNQQTIEARPVTVSAFKAGVVLKRVDAANYLEVYVDDNATNSRLRIDVIKAGARENLASTNLAERMPTNTDLWVRGRIEGNTVTAEHFTTAPTPMGAPTTTNTVTLAGANLTAVGAAVKGSPGRVWIPQINTAILENYTVEPYTYRNVALPTQLGLGGAIPGDAPAKADITLTPSGGAAAPVWALLSWSTRAGSGLASDPFGLFEAEAAGDVAGWVVTSNAGARGGSMLKDAAASAGDTYTARRSVDPSLLVADDFTQGEVAVAVWARVLMDSTIVSPRLTLSTRPQDGLSYGSERWSDEWGSAGKLLTPPSSGTGIWRLVKLGTLRMLVDRLRPRVWYLWINGGVGAGSSGAFGLDYIFCTIDKQQACGPTSKPLDSTYPSFVTSTSETSKTIRSDLSAVISKPPAFGHPDHGLGEQLIELPPGLVDLFVKLSSLAPDDPTEDASTEQLSHAATVHVAVTPRWYLTRSE